MNSVESSEPQSHWPRQSKRLGMIWIAASGLGPMVGAIVARIVFPDAAFGGNALPAQQLGFAIFIAIFFGVAQWFVLKKIVRYPRDLSTHPLDFWAPATAIGVVVMLVPMWLFHPLVYIMSALEAPWRIVYPMIPGTLLLAILQWFLLRVVATAGIMWTVRTVLGVFFGSIAGLYLGLQYWMPVEVMWALVTGASIGLFQSGFLVSLFTK